MSMCSPVYCDTDTPPRNVAATLLDPPYDDDDDGDAVVVDNGEECDARWYDCLGKCLDVTKKELHRDPFIFEWLKSQKPWMKSKKIKNVTILLLQYNTNWKFQIERWKIAIIGGHQLLLGSEQSPNFLRRKLSLERKYIFWRSL